MRDEGAGQARVVLRAAMQLKVKHASVAWNLEETADRQIVFIRMPSRA